MNWEFAGLMNFDEIQTLWIDSTAVCCVPRRCRFCYKKKLNRKSGRTPKPFSLKQEPNILVAGDVHIVRLSHCLLLNLNKSYHRFFSTLQYSVISTAVNVYHHG